MCIFIVNQTPLSSFAAKYCSLVEQEGGLTLLEELLNSNAVVEVPYPRVLELASIVRENVTSWKEREAEEEAAAAGANEDLEDGLDLDG